MPYKIHHNNNTFMMKNPFNPFESGLLKNDTFNDIDNSMLIEGLKSISQSFFIWRFIFYYFIFKNNHKNIYNNLHNF